MKIIFFSSLKRNQENCGVGVYSLNIYRYMYSFAFIEQALFIITGGHSLVCRVIAEIVSLVTGFLCKVFFLYVFLLSQHSSRITTSVFQQNFKLRKVANHSIGKS